MILLPFFSFFLYADRSFLESPTFNIKFAIPPLLLYLWDIFDNSWSKRFLPAAPPPYTTPHWDRSGFFGIYRLPLSSVTLHRKLTCRWFDLPSFSGGQVIQQYANRWSNRRTHHHSHLSAYSLLPHYKQIIHEEDRTSIQLSLKMLLVYIKDEDKVRCMFRDALDKLCLGKLPLNPFAKSWVMSHDVYSQQH